MKLRLTVTCEYDADPADYGTDDPVLMAQVDQGNADSDPLEYLDGLIDEDGFKVTVEPVQ